jgi:effector-binding domain-containing protein
MQIGRNVFGPGRAKLLALAFIFLAAPLPLAAQQPSPDAPKAQTPDAAKPDAPETPKSEAPKDSSAAEESAIKTEDVSARATIASHGAANWDEGYAKIGDAIGKLRAAAQKAGLKETGRPLAVFTDTDDAGFKFDAMLPVESPTGAKPELGADVALAQTPSGKALKFQHRGAYDDIDSTYEAITAYMDEKGLEARNLFVEEYVNDAKDSSDMALQVDIYVFLK